MKNLNLLLETNLNMKFKCKSTNNNDDVYIVSTTSTLEPEASKKDLKVIQKLLNGFELEFINFYKKYNGGLFHHDENIQALGLALFPVNMWKKSTKEMKSWYDMLEEDELEEMGIDWLDDCVVFAEVPFSGNYFAIVLKGKLAGKIIYSDHDNIQSNYYATSFNHFLEKYLSDPIKEIAFFGSYARYDDGETDKQWIPIKTV